MLTWYLKALSLLGIVKVLLLSLCVNLPSYSGLLMGVRSCLWNWFKRFSFPDLFSHMFVLFVLNPKISRYFVILQVKFLRGKIALGFLRESLTMCTSVLVTSEVCIFPLLNSPQNKFIGRDFHWKIRLISLTRQKLLLQYILLGT